ncbi:hypothetical protein PPACK8108_LOCUS7593 [Phakopsora pachyrhizi]|uniref:Uncharacterized protein n=1 Tax=Phakopsora pachyrhizi TaxID=170000 RepID=A0AAV0ATA8_PHAPC|nr:hypothetical protein PPACK8108_LOCUS7593 [Phakopsora pachyrhizi]
MDALPVTSSLEFCSLCGSTAQAQDQGLSTLACSYDCTILGGQVSAVMVPFYKIADAFKKDDPTLPDYSFRTTPIIIKEADGWAGEYKRVFVELLLFLLLMPAEENANEVVELDGLAAGTAFEGNANF